MGHSALPLISGEIRRYPDASEAIKFRHGCTRRGKEAIQLKAITLQQPWATLVAIGAKRIETRSWSTSYRGPLAIASSARQGKAGKALMCDPQCYGAMQLYAASGYWGGMAGHPYGAVIAVCNLVDCLPMEAHICLPGVFDEYPELNTTRELAFGDFNVFDAQNGRRRWAFVLEDIQALAIPVPVKGGLGLWEFNQ